MILSFLFIPTLAATLSLTSTNETTQQPVALQQQVKQSSSTNAEANAETALNQEANSMLQAVYVHRKPPQGFLSPYEALATMPHNISEYKHASGNWFGSRDTLDAHGVEFSATYTTDMAANPVGGIHPGGFTYADNFSFGCLVETEKLFGWHGGYFTISSLQRDGNSLSQKNIGNQFTVQQLYGGQTFHFYELSYEQREFNDHASLKSGRIAAGDEFASSPLYWLYMNNAIDGNPQSIPVNGKFSAYPNATWGSRLKIDLPHDTLARLGIYQVTQTSRHGLNWDFYPTDGVMLLAQYGWNPEFCNPSPSKTSSSKNNSTATSSKENSTSTSSKNPDTPLTSKGLTGHYWMGGYYSTFEYAQFNSGIQASNAYGLYWHADQTVYRPNPLGDEGLVLWGVTTLCPQQNISLLPFQVNAGAVYTGLIPSRKDDFTIFGVMYGNFSTSYAGIQQQNGNGNPTYELVYELGYRINMTKFAYIQPDLQWVINPKGTGNIPNAVVLGAQMGVVF